MPARARAHRVFAARVLTAAGVGTLLGAMACASSDGGTAPKPGLTPSMTLSLSTSGVTVQRDSVALIEATISYTAVSSRNIELTFSGVPADVDISVAATADGPGTQLSLLGLSVSPTAKLGTYPITVHVRAFPSVIEATATFTLVVIPSVPRVLYTIGVNPLNHSIPVTGSAFSVISLQRFNFTGPVSLSITGAPVGVTATFEPESITGTTAVMTLNVARTVAPGSYTVFVQGAVTAPANQPNQLAPFTIVVPGPGSYVLTTVPASLLIAPGRAATVSINVFRIGDFRGAVAVTATGMPPGMAASIFPVVTAANEATLSLSTSATIPPGTYTLTLTGASTDVAPVSTTMQVVVTTGGTGGGSGNVRVDYSGCQLVDRPVWLAYQDGDGAWTSVAGINDVYGFDITAPRGGVAWVSQGLQANSVVTVRFYSRSEMISPPLDLCGTVAGGTSTVTGTVAGLSPNDIATIALADASTLATPANNVFTIARVRNGTHDLVAYRRDLIFPFLSDRGYIRRNVIVSDGAGVGLVDFAGSESFLPTLATFTASNTGGDVIGGRMSYLVRSACTPAPLYQASFGTASTFTMAGVPAARQESGDFHQSSVSAVRGNMSRTVVETFRTFAARTIVFPPVLANVQVTSLTGPYKRLQTAFTLPIEYGAMGLAYYDAGARHSVSVSATRAYLESSAAVVGLPDLSVANGWNNGWAPATSAQVTTSSFATGSTPNGGCSENGRVVNVQVTGAH